MLETHIQKTRGVPFSSTHYDSTNPSATSTKSAQISQMCAMYNKNKQWFFDSSIYPQTINTVAAVSVRWPEFNWHYSLRWAKPA